jgi:hypothetical protein
MARPLRFVPANALVEVTTRTFQGRLLLKPSPGLTEIILGVIGKAQGLYGMAIHAFVLVSTHAHFLLSPSSAGATMTVPEVSWGRAVRRGRLGSDPTGGSRPSGARTRRGRGEHCS